MTPISSRALLRLAGPLVALACLAGGPAAAQSNYPNHAISLVVPFSAGGPTDVVARSLGAAMSKTLGQSIIIENRTGAGGTPVSYTHLTLPTILLV